MIPDRDDDREVLAGEYVLGLLGGVESARVERLRRTDGRLDRAVDAWQEWLAELDWLVPPVVPDATVWARISDATMSARPPIAVPRSLRPRQSAPASLIDRLWSSVPFWRATGLAGACVALALAILTYVRPPPDPAAPVAIIVLLASDARPGWVVEARADATLRVLPLVPQEVPEGRSLQLWTLRDRAEGPISLGLMPPQGLQEVSLDDLPLPVPGQLFEITLEPVAGSPIGRPTGPILYKGNIAGAPAV